MPVSTIVPEKLLHTREEVAKILGVSVRGVDSWIRDGLLATVPLGRLVRIHRDELERVAREGIRAKSDELS